MRHLVVPGICFATVFTSTAIANPDDPCLADVNKDSMLTAADFTAWTAAFNLMDPIADQNCDGVVEPNDFSSWVSNYNAGCDLQDHDGDGIASIYEDGGMEWFGLYKRGTNHLLYDSDSDGLPDSDERRTYVFLSTTDTGTDPNKADTDGDTIDDGDESLGTPDGLDLPSLGANPLRRDLFVEIDWHTPLNSSLDDNHYRPTAASLQAAIDMFTNAPLANPDGTTGISLHIDYGQDSTFTGGNLVSSWQSSVLLLSDVDNVVQPANFAANRYGIFFYCFANGGRSIGGSAHGRAELGGDTSILSRSPSDYTAIIYSRVFAHELGHCLGLRHGGNLDLNNKPNYNSIMNYRFSTVDDGADGIPDGVTLDYSSGTRATITADAIDESLDMYGIPLPVGSFFDWNQNGVLDAPYPYDLTASCQLGGVGHCGTACPAGCQVVGTQYTGVCEVPIDNKCCVTYFNIGLTCYQTYRDHDDWNAIRLTPLNNLRSAIPEYSDCTGLLQ